MTKDKAYIIRESLSARGLSEKDLDDYKAVLISGYPFIKLYGNCRLHDDIHSFNDSDRDELITKYKSAKGLKILKFVPASGAASRMFKDLFTALETGNYSGKAKQFFDELMHYAFAEELLKRSGLDKKQEWDDREKRKILETLLLPEGMDYGNLPKGMIRFHKYDNGHTRTAFEEHFHEAARYASSGDKVYLHFTIPLDAEKEVKSHLAGLKDCLGKMYEVEYLVETSVQKPKTDTPAIYEEDKEWVFTEDNELLFRPAGHGALIENLNDLSADIIFVKNIDNVVPDHLKAVTYTYKELLAGVLLEVQEGLFSFLEDLDRKDLDIEACESFMKKWFGMNIKNTNEDHLRQLLDRPIRVCGMVQNEGEPGGGPFLVEEQDKEPSLQIVEKAQVDLDDPDQKEVLLNASHFNPVDLVLGTKNYKGNKFNLLEYRNPNTGMVVSKTYLGREIRALELPGLWNGSMHNWNTVFVEVPIETFNPVKTVFDLTRPAHT